MADSKLFDSIALVGRHSDPNVADSLRALAEHLANRQRKIIVDATINFEFPVPVEKTAESQVADRADLVIAIGGDGTMLHAARMASAANTPLLGVNRGRLGFLADISPTDMCERLDEVLAGRFERETRTMLNAQLQRADSMVSSVALNDVVVQKWETGRILEFETWIDDQYVNTHRGDGLIVASSTGSTAYALSCGGPILHPQLEALVLAPICPHTLSDRPIVVHSRSRVEVRLVQRPHTKAQITCDGVLLGDFTSQDRLAIVPAAKQVTLLHPPGHNYYRVLRSKLHWGRGEKIHER